MKIFLNSVLLFNFIFANVVINEVMYDPKGDDTGKEWIELYNNGNEDINLINYELFVGTSPYFVFPQFVLKTKKFVVIYLRCEGTNTETVLYEGKGKRTTNMGNSKGSIALFNSSQHTKTTIIDFIEYGDTDNTWETTAISASIWAQNFFIPDVEENQSIGRKIDGNDNNSISDWKKYVFVSPGYSNIQVNIKSYSWGNLKEKFKN